MTIYLNRHENFDSRFLIRQLKNVSNKDVAFYICFYEEDYDKIVWKWPYNNSYIEFINGNITFDEQRVSYVYLYLKSKCSIIHFIFACEIILFKILFPTKLFYLNHIDLYFIKKEMIT